MHDYGENNLDFEPSYDPPKQGGCSWLWICVILIIFIGFFMLMGMGNLPAASSGGGGGGSGIPSFSIPQINTPDIPDFTTPEISISIPPITFP